MLNNVYALRIAQYVTLTSGHKEVMTFSLKRTVESQQLFT